MSDTVSPGRAAGEQAVPAEAGHRGGRLLWPVTTLAAFAVLCVVVLSVAPALVEVDDYAYRASIIAITDGHFLTLSTAQTHALEAQLAEPGPGPRITGPGGSPPSIAQWQWVQLPSGRWISEKDPGYPFLAEQAPARRRTGTGLLGFLAIEAAVFVRYTDIVVLGCAVVTVLAARRLRPASTPPASLWWWLGSVALFGAGVALFDDAVYGGPLKSGYRPGEVTFSLGAIIPNLRSMPPHLLQAMPVLVLALAGVVWITLRWVRLRRAGGDRPAAARRDFAVGLALALSWFTVWGLYAAYAWTAQPGLGTVQTARFYVPAMGAITLLGAWPLGRLLDRVPLAAAAPAAAVVALFGLGIWSYTDMVHPPDRGVPAPPGCIIGEPHCPVNPAGHGGPRESR